MYCSLKLLLIWASHTSSWTHNKVLLEQEQQLQGLKLKFNLMYTEELRQLQKPDSYFFEIPSKSHFWVWFCRKQHDKRLWHRIWKLMTHRKRLNWINPLIQLTELLSLIQNLIGSLTASLSISFSVIWPIMPSEFIVYRQTYTTVRSLTFL